MNTRVDPVTFQIIRHKLNHIVEEGVITLEMVGGNPITTEGHDMMVSLYTADGGLLLGGVGFLHHITSAAQAVKHIIGYFGEEEGINEDDVFLFNDSYSGALHPPDVFTITPVHFEGKLCAFVANFVHVTDIGAIDPGGFSPNAKDNYHEGFQTKGLKIVERGKIRRDIFETILNQVRDPHMVALDIKSQLAANHVSKERMKALFSDYGYEAVSTVSEELIAESERLMRQRLRELPDGTWWARQYVDTPLGCFKAELSATKQGDTLTYDFTGSDPQAPIGINCSYWATWGGLFAPLFPLLAWDITWNEGATRPIRLIAPEGTVVNATRPAPISIATVSMINIVNNLSTIVLSKMLGATEKFKRRATAVWYGSHSPITCFGRNGRDEWYAQLLTDVFCGAGGGMAFKDGVDLGGELPNVVSRWGNVEHHELRTPLLYLYRRVVPDSAGPGKYRGGASHEYAFTPHGANGKTMGLVCYGKGSFVPMSHGLFGGYPGCHTGYSTFRNANVAEWPHCLEATRAETHEAKQWGSQEIKPGDIEYLRLTAGGGYGDPLDREPEAVMRDVLGRIVSETCAKDIYGVIIDTTNRRVDLAASKSKRIELRAARIGVAPSKILPYQLIPATGKRIGEYLQEKEEGAIQCTYCGTVLSSAGVHWKDVTPSRRSPFSVAGPFRPGMEDYALGESFCPGCATLLDVDLVNSRDGLLRDEIVRWPEPHGEQTVS